MPVVIEDMTVTVEINQSAQSTGSSQSGGVSGAASGTASSGVSEQIRRCVDEVMEVIRQQNER